ncbi:ubiquitinyl hydrolase [Ramicandelaber brevisporus]|nr:ubiquitinyl hydrolase [Ramicandelaber brevisporus]
MACTHALNARLVPPTADSLVYKEECTQCFDTHDDDLGINVCLSCFNGGCLDPQRAHAETHYRKSAHPLALNIRRVPRQATAAAAAAASSAEAEASEQPPPHKMTKLMVVEKDPNEDYELLTKVICYACGVQSPSSAGEVDVAQVPGLANMVDAVLLTVSAEHKRTGSTWEEPPPAACEHSLMINQVEPTAETASLDRSHCSSCDLKENLWLCLACGAVGCGRRQFDGSGGNNHAIDHFKATGHAVNVKLGTITPEGSADVFCYACDDASVDFDLRAHLATFGINVHDMVKTDRTLAEMQLEYNLKFDFAMTSADGTQLPPVFGPGLTGIRNLGNTCYMASVLQSVFAVPEIAERYGGPDSAIAHEHHLTCSVASPAKCFHCQMGKLADGLLSGRYSKPATVRKNASESDKPAADEVQSQDGISPGMFKSLIGQDHPEFSTMRQQDAHEFFQHLVKVVQQREKVAGTAGATSFSSGNNTANSDPTTVFACRLEHRLECQKCHRVRYTDSTTTDIALQAPAIRKSDAVRPNTNDTGDGDEAYEPVTLAQCLDLFTMPHTLEGYNCPHCKTSTTATSSTRFATFPRVLAVQVSRFIPVNWVPTKISVPVIISDGAIDLEPYRGHGPQPNEELLPADEPAAGAAVAAEPQFDADALMMLQEMGFPEIRCKKALIAVGPMGGVEAAAGWLFEHMEDPDIDAPIVPQTAPVNDDPSIDTSMLEEMGFTRKQGLKALRETNGDIARAVDWLFNHPEDMGDVDVAAAPATAATSALMNVLSAQAQGRYYLQSFISHKGTSVHCGHYVAHVRRNFDEQQQQQQQNTHENGWVLYNDSRVVQCPDAPSEHAYLYFFSRI